MLSKIVATVTLRGISPYVQSQPYDDPPLEGESAADRDLRLWAKHMHVINDNVHIKATAMMKSAAAGAKYSGKKIAGKGAKTWTQKFEGGIAIFNDIDIGVRAEDVQPIKLYMNLDGIRGSAKRGHRHYPWIAPGWTATFDFHILDPEITQTVFEEMLEIAGMFIGIGQNRPEKGGQCGRFECTAITWKAERQPVARAA